jgi:DNA polymerase elongation subunit (family B)
MSTNKTKVDPSIIESFLNGNNPKKYVVSIEAGYSEPAVSLIINDPIKGKRIEKHSYKPFLWFKADVISILYGGKKMKAIQAGEKYGVKSKRLKISDANGNTPERLANGYTYLATCTKSYNNLIQFFKEGGIDVFDKKYSKLFFMFTPVEQYMIQTGVRLFKGMDDYNDLHRLQFDLETEGLSGKNDAIFQTGIRDNRGFEVVLETIGSTAQEKRDSERENLYKFFKIIDEIKPDVITGYNSESFDWKFIVDRAERLMKTIDNVYLPLDRKTAFKRKPSMLKLGNEQEAFEQTYMWGYNVIDIAHSVRRAQAINSDIKSWGLKYITQYSNIAKENRVYVPGDKIHATWNDTENQYAFNDKNGDWYKISDRMGLKEDYQIVKGDYIVQRYLLDDLWETEQIDTIFNQAAFLIAKMLPTTYSRSATMGTASQWKLIMSAWSYENNLAIPETEPKREFTGGLSRLLELGYARNVVKLDYAALYPKNQLTHDIFPDLDISGVMEGMLTYVVDTRDKFKFLTGEHKAIAKGLQKEYDKTPVEELKEELKKHKALANLYDKKQLPLKILANSWFGAYGAPYIFNWGDSDCAEETTCRGRQYLRLMVKHFSEKYGFKALVGDTDGFNFSFPDNINDVKYLAKGSHWKTEKDAGKELVGLEAVLAEFNENYMIGRMGLDIDDICNSTINFSRKNYANDIGGKIKFVGNSIKSKKMPAYIEDFLSVAIRLLLDGKGKEFVNYYYDYVDKIYNFNIPLAKIASKSKVKSSIDAYKLNCKKKNKAGNPMPRQAHMELAIREGLDIHLGDTLYYVNTGTSKSQGDLKTIVKSKMTRKELECYFIANNCYPKDTEVQLNCKLIPSDVVDFNMETMKEIDRLKKILKDTTDENKINEIKNNIQEFESQLLTEEYNVAKYLEAFNKKVEPLLVCFHTDIRHKILLKIKKDKKTKLEKLEDKQLFTEQQCELVSGMPDNPEDQDTYEELMTMEDKEIKFWDKVNKVPNNIDVEEWEKIRVDYIERMILEKEQGILFEKEKLDEIFRHLELNELRKIENDSIIPKDVLIIAEINYDTEMFVSRKWSEPLCPFLDIFKYENDAIERDKWYQLMNNSSDDRFEQWLEYKSQNEEFLPVNFSTAMVQQMPVKELSLAKDKIAEIEKAIIKQPKIVNDDSEIDEDSDIESEYNPEALDSEIDNFIPEFQKADFEIESGEEPTLETKNLLESILNTQVEEDDEWNF